jgi:hypothetical protein
MPALSVGWFRRLCRRGALVSLGLLLSCSLPFNSPSDAEREAVRGAPTIVGLGTSTFEVTANDPEARRLFHQGLQLNYAFEQAEAARAFRAAYARDRSCAICAWGVAYALGPNINATERRNENEIRRYLDRAQAVSSTPIERALIQALSVRYGDAPAVVQQDTATRADAMCSTGTGQRDIHPLERAYALAMTDVFMQFPHDPDVVTIYADAVMVSSAWRWWDPKTGAPSGAMGVVVARLQEALKEHPQHTGLTHFLVHAAEQSPNPELAEPAAEQLGKLAPGAPHLVHMPSHIYVHTGRFAASERVNEQALEVQKTYNEQITKAGFTVIGTNWDFHHLHFLWFSALMEGRGDLALATARRMAGFTGSAEAREYVRALPLQTLVRLERWDQVLAEPKPVEGLGMTEGIWEYAQGVAFARTGRLDEAQQAARNLARVRQLPTLTRATFMGRPLFVELLQMSAAVLDAEIVFAPGHAASAAERSAAIEALQRAAKLEDEIGGEPPRWAASTRLALADALRADQRYADAEREYREHLRHQRDNGWALRGLRQAVAVQDRASEAQALDAQLHVVWAQADPNLLTVR